VTFQKLTLTLAAAAVIWAIASVAAMTSGALVIWPDYVHTNFGIPFTFAVHTSNTIAGPVDTWDVDLSALTADLAFWIIGMTAIVLAGLARNPRVAVTADK
jgi:hypothetical protein